MAIYHCSIKIIGRGKGKSAVRSAAYRAGERIKNDYDGQIYDYTRKGGVVHTEVLLPDHAPREYLDRAVLWNAVESIESKKNAQLAREIEFALPVELSLEQNILLTREYVKKHFVSAGMCADICVHDTDTGNPHAHIMLTMRPIEMDGAWGAKSKKEYILDDNGERLKLPSGEYRSRQVYLTDWHERARADEWREGWADILNEHLSRHGIAERVDHRSYTRQGIDKVPSIHLGVAASRMERKGIRTERGDINRQVAVTNQQLRQLRTRIRKTKDWLYAQPLTDAPTIIDMMNGIAGGKNLETHWQKLRNLKTQAKVLIFLQENKITDMAQLADKVTRINEKFYEVSNSIKKVERRLDTLEQHLAHYDNYKRYKAVYEKHRQLDPKKRDAFYDKHSEAIQLYETAKQYLDGVMNGRTTVPVKAWQAEQSRLTSEKFLLCDDYYRLQDETRSAEVLRKSAEGIMGDITPERIPTQKRDLAR
jgi:hypothetical protein